MVFVPTPQLLFDEEIEQGTVVVLNWYSSPMPEALSRCFYAMGASAGEVMFEDEMCACWRFVAISGESEYETTRHLVEQRVREFKEQRGEGLCSLEGTHSAQNCLSITEYTRWYIRELKRREKILDTILQSVTFPSYEGRCTAQRALYRVANRHPEIAWWQNEREDQLCREWEEERKHEATFADIAFAERKKASGLRVGTVVRTLVVPKGARTIPVPIDTIGTIAEETDLYWMVAFSLPLTDCDETTWLPHDEKTSITIGYLTEELYPIHP